MSRSKNRSVTTIQNPRRLVQAMRFCYHDGVSAAAWGELIERFPAWIRSPEGALALSRVVCKDGHPLAYEIWQAIADHLVDYEALASIAGGCEGDRQASREAMTKLTSDANTPLRTMMRLYVTAYRLPTASAASVWLAYRVDPRFLGYLGIVRDALDISRGIGYFTNTRCAFKLRYFSRGQDVSSRRVVFRREPAGQPTLMDLSRIGLLAMALCGDRKKAACAACLLFIRSNPSDGIYDVARELCQSR